MDKVQYFETLVTKLDSEDVKNLRYYQAFSIVKPVNNTEIEIARYVRQTATSQVEKTLDITVTP